MRLLARFECHACHSTAVVRERFSERPTPVCASCSEGTGGYSEMVWVGDVEA